MQAITTDPVHHDESQEFFSWTIYLSLLKTLQFFVYTFYYINYYVFIALIIFAGSIFVL
jgi:hypothetical protein